MLCDINFFWFYIRLIVVVKGYLVINFKNIFIYDIVINVFKWIFLEINYYIIKEDLISLG